MAKLCQITALLNGKKTATQKTITEIYHKLQKPVLFQGLSKKYVSLMEEGEVFPDEKQKVQYKVEDCLKEVEEAVSGMLDLVIKQDLTNCKAVADVKVDGVVILEKVPVTHLLFLEKQLTDLHTILTSIPTLDLQENWTYDPNVGYNVSEETWTNKTKKVPRNHIKYEATKEHPAQVEMYHEDIIIGKWKTMKFSGAMSADKKQAILSKLSKLQEAVKCAREEANTIDAVDASEGGKIFKYLFN